MIFNEGYEVKNDSAYFFKKVLDLFKKI